MIKKKIYRLILVAVLILAQLPVSAVLSAIDWRMVLSSAIVAGIVSILTSVAGLPEAPCEGE